MTGAGDDTDGDEREAGGRGGLDDDRSEAETEWDTEHATRDGERDETTDHGRSRRFERRHRCRSRLESAAIDAGPGRPDPDGEPDPGPNAVRNWALLLLGLAVVSFVTAAVTVSTGDDVLPVIGATVVGVTFAAIAVVSVQRAPGCSRGSTRPGSNTADTSGSRRAVRVRNRPRFPALARGVNLFELVLELLEEELFPELEDEEFELTASFSS